MEFKSFFFGFNTYDTALVSVMFGKFLNIFFRIFNTTILFRMVGLPAKINFKFTKFDNIDLVFVLVIF